MRYFKPSNTFKKLKFLSLFLLTLACANDEDLDISNADEFNTFIREEMNFQKMPSAAILIFKGDNIVHESYLGKADIDSDRSLEANHLFLLASISKTITATALLQLYDEGRFTLDSKINDYLPFNVNLPSHTEEITFRMLLTHTSGIADGDALDDQYYFNQDSPIQLKSFLENYLTPNGTFYNATQNFHSFTPGSRHEYSNIGNALMGLLVEEISTQDFNSYCKQNIFSPLGMNDTYWRLDEITNANKTIVRPYNYQNGSYQPVQHYTFTDYPNGGLRSTALDLFRFLKAFGNNGSSNGYRLLKSETVGEMLTLQTPNLSNDMGLHMFQMDKANNLWGHDGGEEGVATIMAINPETKVGAIILTNQGEADLDQILVEAYKLGLSL